MNADVPSRRLVAVLGSVPGDRQSIGLMITLLRHARPGIGVAVGVLAIRFGGESMGRRLGADYYADDVPEVSHRMPGWIASLGQPCDQSPEFPH